MNDYLFQLDFNSIVEKYFNNIIIDDDYRVIRRDNYSITYSADAKPAGATMFSLYGEAALFELIRITKIYDWQIFDTVWAK